MKGMLLLALLALLSRALPASAAEELGRLFFTPQQRQALDRRRAANIQESLVVQESTLTLQGKVSRSSGRTTTWINGVPQHDSQRGTDPARAAIQAGENEAEITLNVGQTRDLVRGETRDGLAGGRIKLNPRADGPR
jgi:hypothetical protein